MSATVLKDSFEGKILRVDGFEGEEVSCEVLINGIRQEELTPVSQHKPIILSGKSVYQFVFKSVSLIKTVSFKVSLFEDDGAQWLPLFDSCDIIETLPEETTSPRFLMVLCRSASLHIIKETEEMSEESSLVVSESDELMPEINLCGDSETRFHTQELLESLDSEFLDQSEIKDDLQENSEGVQSDRLNKIWESDNLDSMESHEKYTYDVFKENQIFKNSLEEITQKYNNLNKIHQIHLNKVQEYDTKFLRLIEMNKEQDKRSQEREESLLELIGQKETELKIAQDEIFRLRADKRKLESEKSRLKDNNDNLASQLSLCSPSPFLEELSYLKKRLYELEKQPKISSCDLEYQIFEKDLIIKQLQKQISKEKNLEFDTGESQNSSVSVSTIDELDEAVKYHSKAMRLPEQLIKDKEQMYLYGNRKLSLILTNGILMCRIGGSFKPFKEYMETFVLDSATIKTPKKKNSVENCLDKEYDANNFKDSSHKLKTGVQRLNKTTINRRRARS
jgi:hypothetical protein